MATKERLKLEVGSKGWKQMRQRCIKPIPGKFSALYYLNAKVLGHEEIVPMTYRMHYAACMFAEGATGIPEIDACRVKMLLFARGGGKSTCITKGRSIQRLLANDDYAIGIANEVTANAEAFLAMIKQEFETNALLRALFPERVFENALKQSPQWTSKRIVIPRKKANPVSPSVLATGVDATVTGVHMNEWMLDDLLSQNAAEAARKGSFGEIEATNEWVKRLQPLLKSPKRDPITIVGTRWWNNDTYEFLQEYFGAGEPVETFKWTLKLPDGEVQTIEVVKQGEIAIFKRAALENGRAIFPERYDEDELEKMQREDPVFFAGQYLLEPTAGGASEFDMDWLKYYELDGEQIRYRDQQNRLKYVSPRDLMCFTSVDPAISDKITAARSAVPTVGLNSDGQFLLDDFAERGLGMFDLAHRVVDSYLRYRARSVFVETIVYQRALLEALAQVARERGATDLIGAISEVKSHGGQSKDYRIYGLEPYFKRGTFYIHSSHRNFIEEYRSFPLNSLRDVLDAISFQKDAWERHAMLAQMGRGGDQMLQKAHADAVTRLRASLGAGGGY